MPKLKRFKKAASGQGSVFSREIMRKDGTTYIRWEGNISLGKDGNGNRKRIVVYGSSQADVVEKINALKQQVSTGTFSDDKRTLAQYLGEWIKHKALEVKPTSIEHYQHHITNSINPDLGSVQIRKLSPAQLRTWIADLSKKVSPNAANKARAVLRNALRQALKDGLIVRNPLEAVAPLKVNNASKDLEWSASEVVMFLNSARTHRHYAAFYLALSTGMRHGEVLGLHWSDIEGDILHVHHNLVRVKGSYEISSPKTERSIRRIALDPETLSVLQEHRNKQEAQKVGMGKAWAQEGYTDLVFTNEKGDPMNPRNFDRDWHKLQAKTRRTYIAEGITEEERQTRGRQIDEGKVLAKIRFHNFRHMHASLLNKAGVDARTIADRIGHTDPAFTLKRYAHVFEDQRKAPLFRLLSKSSGVN